MSDATKRDLFQSTRKTKYGSGVFYFLFSDFISFVFVVPSAYSTRISDLM